MATRRTTGAAVLADPISADLKQVLRTLKLGKLLDTLPERLTLARQQNLPHADFLELVLADEVARRDTTTAALRARAAGLDPAMRLDTWDTSAAVRFDQQLWNELVSLRFLDGPHGALLLGPVGVGKTHLGTALGHIAVRRRVGGRISPVSFGRAAGARSACMARPPMTGMNSVMTCSTPSSNTRNSSFRRSGMNCPRESRTMTSV